jgi:hypothetical protein
MLKIFAYISVISYLAVVYGQNFFEFGSEIRKDFYFIGMSINLLIISFTLFKAYKNVVTSFFLFLCMGSLFNQVFFHAELSHFEVYSGIVGVIYVLGEKYFSKKIKKWLRSS